MACLREMPPHDHCERTVPRHNGSQSPPDHNQFPQNGHSQLVPSRRNAGSQRDAEGSNRSVTTTVLVIPSALGRGKQA